MIRVALWQVAGDRPKRVETSSVRFQEHLETWIAEDPTLVSAGLSILGRQITLDNGRLDLLAADLQGRLTVIEVKRGLVGRKTVGQALDYAAAIAMMPAEEIARKITSPGQASPQGLEIEELVASDGDGNGREVGIIVVGTTRAPGMERLVNFLSGRHAVPIQVVTFQLFEGSDGQQIIVRELTESEAVEPSRWIPKTIDEIMSRADREGIGHAFRALYEAAARHGLHARPYKRSIMYTPITNRTRMLFTAWAKPSKGRLPVYSSPQAFSEFFPVSKEEAATELGQEGWILMATEDALRYAEGLDRLLGKTDVGSMNHEDENETDE